MKPVLFSVSYAGYWGQHALSLEKFIPRAAQLGYAGVELATKRPHLSPLDWDDERLDGLAALCADNGIEVACLAGYTNFSGGLSSTEVPFVEMQIAYIETLARMAARLGCPLVRSFTAYERADVPPAQIWATTVTAIRECCDRAAEHGVNIGIQNHHDIAVHSKALGFMLEEIDRPNCGLMFDAWSPCLRGEDAYEAARAMAPHTVHTTFADYVRLPRSHYQPALVNYAAEPVDLVRAVPMGEGDLDSAGFLRGLRDGGYDGPVAYEMCSPVLGGGDLGNLDHCARQFVSWLEEQTG